jgi:Family of unknown function (DUF6411)
VERTPKSALKGPPISMRTVFRLPGSGTLGVGQSAGSKAPGPLGRWFQKPFSTSRKATNKSAQKGREGRSKMPL